jgi:hypothetical protein
MSKIMISEGKDLRKVQVTRYVTPLREGGSMPALVEADDNFLYVLKFRGAGQGPKALIAELLGGEIARLLGLKVPELVFTDLNEAFGRTEPDEEIQDLLKASTGLNLAMCPQSNIDSIQANLIAFENIAAGLTTGGPIAEYIPVERFRWLTATRSTIVQCSKIHPGFCTNPELKLNQLFSDYVEVKEM